MTNKNAFNMIGKASIILGFMKFAIDLYRYISFAHANPVDLIIATGMILLGIAIQHREANIVLQEI